jgi:hypothetical protein
MCRRAKILIRRKRERERSAGGPVGRPEERTDQTITTWAKAETERKRQGQRERKGWTRARHG